MKARPITQETVYLYHISQDSQRGQDIARAMEGISVPVEEIKEELLGETLGYCLGLPGFPKTGGPIPEAGFEEEVLVMKGFTKQSMDRMLKEFQRKNIPPVALKAVLTEHNSKWRCIDFFKELKREHLFMNAYQSLRRLVFLAEQQKGQTAELQEAVRKAREQLAKGDQVSFEELAQVLEELKNSFSKNNVE